MVDAPTSEAESLIELFFELDDPEERDVVIEKLAAFDDTMVTEFFRAVADEDDDPYLRAAAWAELARRGVPEGIAALEKHLADPDEPYFFEHAVQSLAVARGPAFYDTLLAISRDPERDGTLQRIATEWLEEVDSDRALIDFERFVDELDDFESVNDDLLEVILLAFVRHDRLGAKARVEALRQRVLASSVADDERDELVGMCDETLALLGAAGNGTDRGTGSGG